MHDLGLILVLIMRTLWTAIIIILIHSVANATEPLRIPVEDVVQKSDHLLTVQVEDVIITNSSGNRIDNPEARTGPFTGNTIWLVCSVKKAHLSNQTLVPLSISIPLDSTMHYSYRQVKESHKNNPEPFLAVLQGTEFRPAYAGVFAYRLDKLSDILLLFKNKEKRAIQLLENKRKWENRKSASKATEETRNAALEIKNLNQIVSIKLNAATIDEAITPLLEQYTGKPLIIDNELRLSTTQVTFQSITVFDLLNKLALQNDAIVAELEHSLVVTSKCKLGVYTQSSVTPSSIKKRVGQITYHIQGADYRTLFNIISDKLEKNINTDNLPDNRKVSIFGHSKHSTLYLLEGALMVTGTRIKESGSNFIVEPVNSHCEPLTITKEPEKKSVDAISNPDCETTYGISEEERDYCSAGRYYKIGEQKPIGYIEIKKSETTRLALFRQPTGLIKVLIEGDYIGYGYDRIRKITRKGVYITKATSEETEELETFMPYTLAPLIPQ